MPKMFKKISATLQILTVGGFDFTKSLPSNSTYVIDLTSSTTTCSALPQLPIPSYGGFAALDGYGTPIVCGGLNSTGSFSSLCLALKSRAWNNYFNLTTER